MVLYKKEAVLKKFAIFTGKQICWSLFLIKLQVFRPATLLKRDSNAGVFLCILQIFICELISESISNLCLRNFEICKRLILIILLL